MAKSVKNKLQPRRKNGYKPVSIMRDGGNVSELDYSGRNEYIEENYIPFITEANMTFSIWDSGFQYDYKADRNIIVNQIIEHYKTLADYTEESLQKETVYQVKDWDLIRRDTDPETDEVVYEATLQEIASDNTYNFSYLGLVHLNWKVFHDEEFDKYFYVIMPHLGGDIRGNYGEAFILEGNDKDELFYRFYEGFISGGASVYFKFMDGSEVSFDSEQDSDVFNFQVNEGDEPTGMALNFLEDFKEFDSWKGDEFLESTIDIYLMRKGVTPKMSLGGNLNDETPRAYIQILPNMDGKWIDLTDFNDGSDVIEHISNWMSELNEKSGGNREEYLVADYEGFGRDMYDEYMGENDFDEIIEAYSKYTNSDFPVDVIVEYKNNMGSGNRTLSDVIDEMDTNYFGSYDNYSDFGSEMIEQGVYTPSDSDVYITDTDKRILAGEESDSQVDDMAFSDLLDLAEETNSSFNAEKEKLEDEISNIESDIESLKELQESSDEQDEYDNIANEIEEKTLELESIQTSLDDIEDRYESIAKEEARSVLYDAIYDRLENDLSSWLDEYGYTDDLTEVNFLSIDYDSVGKDLANDYLVVEYDGKMYLFNNYSKGGRLKASKTKTKYDFYIVENSTKKLVSGYNSKEESVQQRKLLIEKFPSMRFEIYPLAKLESTTNLDVNAKSDYVQLSALDKLKKVSVDAYRYGKDKVNQAQVFLEKNDVKGKIKRGARKVTDKTKQGADWLRKQWIEADFGDGTGRAKFFADGGGVDDIYYIVTGLENRHDLQYGDSQNFKRESEAIKKAEEWFKKDDVGESTVQRVNKTKNTIDTVYRINNTYPLGERVVERPRMFADGGGVDGEKSTLQDKIDHINNTYYDVVASKMYSDNRIQVVSPYFNTLNEIKRKEFNGNGFLERYGNLSSYVLYTNEVYADGGGVDEEEKEYTYNNLIEILSLKDKGFKTISLNGFSESINYVIDLNLDDEELIKVGDRSYETTYKKGGGVGDKSGVIKFTYNQENFEIKYPNGEEWSNNMMVLFTIGSNGNLGITKFFPPNRSKSLKTSIHNAIELSNTELTKEVLKEIKELNNEFKSLKNEYGNGGGVESLEPIVKPVPTTKPMVQPKPSKGNPYKPKTTPRPKASTNDFILIEE